MTSSTGGPQQPKRGPLEQDILRFETTLGTFGAFRDQPTPDVRVAKFIAVACELLGKDLMSRDGMVARLTATLSANPSTVRVNYEEAYNYSLFPLFRACMVSGGQHARTLGVCLLYYSRLPFRQLAIASTGNADAFDRRWPEKTWEAGLAGWFVTYGRALDRDGGMPGLTIGHAGCEWITGTTDRVEAASAARFLKDWMSAQMTLWQARVAAAVEEWDQPTDGRATSRAVTPDYAEEPTTGTESPPWSQGLPQHVELSPSQIAELEVIRLGLRVSNEEFGFHIASHPESSKMLQRGIFSALREQFPTAPTEVLLALLVHSRFMAAKMSGEDLFGLNAHITAVSREPTEGNLKVIVATLDRRGLRTLEGVLAAIADEEDRLPSSIPPEPSARAAVARITEILARGT